MTLLRPTLETKHLILRPYLITDAKDIQKYAGDPNVSCTTLSIPFPYYDGMAETWIKFLETDNTTVTLCVISKTDGHMIGNIGLHMDQSVNHAEVAEIGFWTAKPFWGQGYCTEAAFKMLEYGFEELGLTCITGHHFRENIASGKIMAKLGMTYEGCLRQRKVKNGEYKDIKIHSILRSEYFAKVKK